jgi:hypothetical protein
MLLVWLAIAHASLGVRVSSQLVSGTSPLIVLRCTYFDGLGLTTVSYVHTPEAAHTCRTVARLPQR